MEIYEAYNWDNDNNNSSYDDNIHSGSYYSNNICRSNDDCCDNDDIDINSRLSKVRIILLNITTIGENFVWFQNWIKKWFKVST